MSVFSDISIELKETKRTEMINISQLDKILPD